MSFRSQIDETKNEIEALENQLKNNRASPLTKIITSKGKMRGELHHLTKKQYFSLMGRPARQSILVKGVIPWHLALDELATERGFKSDEELKEAVEKAQNDKLKLDSLKSEFQSLKKRAKYESDKPESVKSDDDFEAPVYPKNTKTKSEHTSLGDTIVLSRRNPSFWQTDVDYKSTPKFPDATLRVRYSKEAKALTKAAIDDEKKRLITSKRVRISKKMPKLV